MNNLSRGKRFAKVAGGWGAALCCVGLCCAGLWLVGWALDRHDTSAVAQEPNIPAAAASGSRYEFSQIHMGIQFRILLYASDQAVANRAATAAFERIGQLNQIMSDYDPASELSRLSATAGSGQAVPVSADLWNVLVRSQELSAASGGAFDVTVGPYVKLWRRARRSQEMPPAERLQEARRSVGFEYMKLDAAARTVTLLKPGMKLDLGGIAVGYAVDDAMRVLERHGLRCALIDGSGDMLAGDPPPGQRGWRVGFGGLEKDAPASHFVHLCHAAVTSAGDAMQFVEIDGQRYSHIVDPRTGLGVTQRSLVVVLAPDCLTADSLDTAVSVLGPTAGLPLIEDTAGTAALIWYEADGETKLVQSKRVADFNLETR